MPLSRFEAEDFLNFLSFLSFLSFFSEDGASLSAIFLGFGSYECLSFVPGLRLTDNNLEPLPLLLRKASSHSSSVPAMAKRSMPASYCDENALARGQYLCVFYLDYGGDSVRGRFRLSKNAAIFFSTRWIICYLVDIRFIIAENIRDGLSAVEATRRTSSSSLRFASISAFTAAALRNGNTTTVSLLSSRAPLRHTYQIVHFEEHVDQAC